MATHSSILTWRIPWTEEPGGLQSIGLHRVRHDWSDLAAAAAAHPLSKASRVSLILYKDEVSRIRSLLYAHPCHTPVSLGVECRVLTTVYYVIRSLHLWLHLPPRFPSLTLLQPYGSPGCSLNMPSAAHPRAFALFALANPFWNTLVQYLHISLSSLPPHLHPKCTSSERSSRTTLLMKPP